MKKTLSVSLFGFQMELSARRRPTEDQRREELARQTADSVFDARATELDLPIAHPFQQSLWAVAQAILVAGCLSVSPERPLFLSAPQNWLDLLRVLSGYQARGGALASASAVFCAGPLSSGTSAFFDEATHGAFAAYPFSVFIADIALTQAQFEAQLLEASLSSPELSRERSLAPRAPRL